MLRSSGIPKPKGIKPTTLNISSKAKRILSDIQDYSIYVPKAHPLTIKAIADTLIPDLESKDVDKIDCKAAALKVADSMRNCPGLTMNSNFNGAFVYVVLLRVSSTFPAKDRIILPKSSKHALITWVTDF